jgi:D-alanyl-D-alanine carboxypeptidase
MAAGKYPSRSLRLFVGRSSGLRRLSGHGVVLIIMSVALASAVSATPTASTRVTAVESEPTPNSAEPAQIALDFGPAPVARVAPASVAPVSPTLAPRTQGADQLQATVSFNPRQGLPQWLRTIREASLWSTSGGEATSLGSLPAGSAYVKPLGPFVDRRVQVYFPGDDAAPAVQAWVDTASVEPSGLPPWAGTLAATAPRRVTNTPAPYVTALHAAIVDEASGQLLYSELPYVEVPQASTTKIATTIVALEREPDLSKRIRVTVSASAMVARDGSSTMGIEPGRSVSLETLLHGMMLPSGNDAAEQVALALADSREQFIEWMNQEVAALGLKDTHFVNPSGMDAAGHYSSAYDMAMLARYAMRNSTFRDLASTMRYTGDGFPMANLNRLLDLYPGADGVKIGFTDAAQKTIVASATRDGHRVYVSLMHSQDLVGDSTQLFDWVWDNFAW